VAQGFRRRPVEAANGPEARSGGPFFMVVLKVSGGRGGT